MIEHHCADPERHAADQPPIDMEEAAQRRLEALSQVLCSNPHGNLGTSLLSPLILASRPTACQYIPGICGMMVRAIMRQLLARAIVMGGN
jgi:hypothetical protein